MSKKLKTVEPDESFYKIVYLKIEDLFVKKIIPLNLTNSQTNIF